MYKKIRILLILTLLCSILLSIPAYAVGDGNIDGGGGDMGQGTGQNKWRA